MANLSTALRAEIIRLSRKEIRKANAVLQRSSVAHRRDIAKLKREIAGLQKELKWYRRAQASSSTRVSADEEAFAGRTRFVAKGFRSLRHRLGLSAAQMGTLLGVSEQSIYNWETKAAIPRRSHLPTIAKLRGIGKREAQRLVQQAR